MEVSEPRKRYICFGSQFQPEMKVFDKRRLSGSTLTEPQGHLEFFETKVQRIISKAKYRLHVVSEASRLGGKTTHHKYSDELKEANKRSARFSLTREAEKADAQLAKERKDTRKTMARLKEAKEADMKLAKARAEQDRTSRS